MGAVTSFIMYISFRGEEGVQQVPTIVRYVLEEFVIGRGADTGKRWRRGGAVAEPGRLPEEGLQARPVVCTGEPPPGRRGVAQLRDNDGLVDYVQCGGWQAVVPQSPQSEQCLRARCQEIVDVFGYGESPADSHAEDLDRLDSRETGNCRCWYLSFHPASRADENMPTS